MEQHRLILILEITYGIPEWIYLQMVMVAHGPIPTVRLHNLRDGFEDAEMFRKLPLIKVSPIVEPLVQSATDFTLDAKLFESQREKVAQLII